MSLKPNRFKQFVSEVYGNVECPKQATNGFIVLLLKSHITKYQHYFESNFNTVANGLINCNDDIHIQGM